MNSPPVILASASPRRKELLASCGLAFEVVPAEVVEQRRPGESPTDYVLRNAREKAAWVAQRHPNHRVIGADTVVVRDEVVLEKPADPAEAADMLQSLSGRKHQVITGVAIVEGGRIVYNWHNTTDVTFRTLTVDEIAGYVGTGEPLDKAGGYGIQAGAAFMVAAIRGSYTNVVGLPLAEVSERLKTLDSD